MKQYIFGIHPAVNIATITGQIWRIPIGLQDSLAGNATVNRITVRTAGTFRNLNLRCFTPVGAGVNVLWSLEKNGVDTGLAVTLSGAIQTIYQNTVDAVHCNVGDDVQWHPILLPGSAALPSTRISLCVEYDSDVANECWYARPQTVMFGNRAVPIFHHQGRIAYTPMQFAKDVMGVPGAITELFAATQNQSGVNTPPGVGKFFSTAIYKNGVRQDGSGGTVDTVCTVSDLATSNVKTFILPIVPGDLIWLDERNSGGLVNFHWRAGIKFVSTIENSSSICANNDWTTSVVNSLFFPPQTEGNWVASLNETEQLMPGPITPLTLNGMIGDIGTPAGDPSEAIHYFLRKNATDAGIQLDFVGAQLTDQAAGAIVLINTDLWDIRKIGTGTTPSSGGAQAITFPGLFDTGPPPPAFGTIIISKVVFPDNGETFQFNAIGLTPNAFTLGNGQTQEYLNVPIGSGYSIQEIVPSGWEVTYEVSNGSPPNNISVTANEIVFVSVTNRKLPNELSGIYKIVPEKRQDTLWLVDFVGTRDVKIP